MLVRRMSQILPGVLKVTQAGNRVFHPEQMLMAKFPTFGHTSFRCISIQKLTNSLELITNTPVKLAAPVNTNDPKPMFAIGVPNPVKQRELAVTTTVSVINAHQPPLCIIFGWLLSKRKHIMNVVNLYLAQGFHVLLVTCTPFQAVWLSGAQVIARDILTFMGNNQQYTSTVLHGFSVGSLVWGQVLLEMDKNPQKYLYMPNMLVGQIWDSLVVFADYNQGMAKVFFPKSPFYRFLMMEFGKHYIKIFNDSVSQPCIQADRLFYDCKMKFPSLFLYSQDDVLSNCATIEGIVHHWKQNGCVVYQKCWASSPHVSHIWRHPEEYRAEMNEFLAKLNLQKELDSFQSKLA